MYEPDTDSVQKALEAFILSASGWRKIFAANGDEESRSPEIRPEDALLTALAAGTFARFVRSASGKERPDVLLATDTRPTGRAIAAAAAAGLRQEGAEILFPGVAAAPEIMAAARTQDAFVYISASHNPIGHNGLKFGLSDGGVLSAGDSARLIQDFRQAAGDANRICRTAEVLAASAQSALQETPGCKEAVLREYETFIREVITDAGTGTPEQAALQNRRFAELRGAAETESRKGKPPAVFADFNGSARTLSVDRKLIADTGFRFFTLHGKPGDIAHRIVPEGSSLSEGAEEMTRLRREGKIADGAVFIGYVPDCDGDRGNLIFWNEKTARAEPLEAQQVFALSVIAELAGLVFYGEKETNRCTVVVNDPTSMRIEKIAAAFGAQVARAEVGEANVVNLARKLRGEGRIVRILGEGSNGGNITHPSAVRDPLSTLFALLKLLLLKDKDGHPGLIRIWLERTGAAARRQEDFTLAGILETIPPFTTTSVFEKNAQIRIRERDHAALKRRFQHIFEKEWPQRKSRLEQQAGITSWTAVRNNGITQAECTRDFGESGKGGLKVIFRDPENRNKAFIWMRGSGTEPVFRVMADAEGADNPLEKELLEWLTSMIRRADT